MDDRTLLLFAIPVFLLSMAIEWAIAKKGTYALADTVSNLSTGMGEQVLVTFTRVATFGAYIAVYEHARLFTLTSSLPVWIALVLAVDLAYYCFHRASHRVAIFWAGHSVHH